jgi:transposase
MGLMLHMHAQMQQQLAQALEAGRQQTVAYVDETGAPTGNADGNNPTGKQGCGSWSLQW